jgi:hypothetical protein
MMHLLYFVPLGLAVIAAVVLRDGEHERQTAEL